MFLDVCTTILTTYMLNALESDKKANWSFDICSPSHIWILYLWVVSLCTQQTSLSFLYPANIFFIPFELSMVCIALSLSCPMDVASSFLLFICLFVCCCLKLFHIVFNVSFHWAEDDSTCSISVPNSDRSSSFFSKHLIQCCMKCFFFVKMLALTLLVNI